MTFQETLQSLSPTARAQLLTFLGVLQQHLSPTDWERLQTFIERMHPAAAGSDDGIRCPARDPRPGNRY